MLLNAANFCLIYRIADNMSHHVIFIGCPGVGKSTLINCLGQNVIFNSGSYCEEKKKICQKKEHKGITYVEITIKKDATSINESIERIQDMIKQRASYQIFFVVTTKKHKVREKDLNAIKSILENNRRITSYNLIINKLSKHMYKEFCKMDELKCVFPNGKEMQSRSPLLLRHQDDLLDAVNEFTKLKDLEKFVESTGREKDKRGNNI